MAKIKIRYKYLLPAVIGAVTGSTLTAATLVGAVGVARQTSGNITKFDVAQVASSQSSMDPDNACTQAQTYEDIPGMSVAFTTGTNDKPSIVNFNVQSAGTQPDTTLPEYAYVRLVVDGNVQTGSAAEKMVASMYGYPENSWQFITDNLGAGDHTATLQWRMAPSPDMASSYCIKDSSMVVLHD